MSDSARRDGSDPPESIGSSYPDPAYASQVPYIVAPTQQFPTSPTFGTDPFAAPPPEPRRRQAPGWLWALAGLSVVLVLCLAIALVIINSNEQQTLVAPPPMPEPSHETTTAPSTSTPSAETAPIPLPIPLPMPGMTTPPGGVAPPGDTSAPREPQTVVYSVSGPGRAINITYIDNGNVLQTEFNVMLPWSKEVQLATPSARSASLSIVNVGRPISCSISINGVPVQHHTGMGLTVCTALSRQLGG
jgi:Mycobacterium membrane protein